MALLRLVTVLAALAATALAPAAAHAAFPGKNGPFVLSLENCYLNRYLVTMPWQGGELQPITQKCDSSHNDDETLPPSYAFPDPAPDGRSLLASRTGNGAHAFVKLNPDGTGLAPVDVPPHVYTGFFSAPSFAPNGRRFAFEADRYKNGYDTEPLWEVQLDGSSARKIRRAAACRRGENCATFENPRWSPDGRLLAVEVSSYVYKPRKPGAFKPGIWLIRARDGKPVRRLTKHGTDVDWSPDGRSLVYRTYFEREEGGGASGGNLYVVSRDGRRKRKLVHRHRVAETHPAWSPDGRWIAWVSLRFGAGDVSFRVTPSLWRVRARGGRPQRIQSLPRPYVEEAEYNAPQLAWLPGSR